jgi:hypothetical protein
LHVITFCLERDKYFISEREYTSAVHLACTRLQLLILSENEQIT